MPPEPARPHAGPWRLEDPTHLNCVILVSADDATLYYLDRIAATAADDALVASAPALRAALERLEWANAHMEQDGEIWHSCPACGNDKRCGHSPRMCWLSAALHAATAPAAPGESPDA
jgi:hypothetical protein